MKNRDVSKIPVIADAQLSSVLRMDDVIEVIERGFREYGKNHVVMPQRSATVVSNEDVLLTMPAYVGGEVKALGAKLATVFASNPERHQLPTVHALIAMFDPETGIPRAILEGSMITAFRTGAVSAIATKFLARTNASVLGVIGTGSQAQSQVNGICAVRKIDKIKVYSRKTSNVDSFVSKMRTTIRQPIEAAKTAKETVQDSDIVITATNSVTPVLRYEWLEPGTHINAVGAYRPTMRELDEDTITNSKLVVDSKEACLAEAGEIAIPISQNKIRESHIYAELAELVNGPKVGRSNDSEVTVFKSVGLAFEDIVTSKSVLDKLKI
ncbi:MAG TPA: ornithine cyclodeaminase family protein [Candidatus Bathyarchaeia archaeon]|nr:ornithine cyclodeaminase family protein [Candidatus Bathyarchaeia archaeon]